MDIITSKTIDINHLLQEAENAATGGTVLFVGHIRNHNLNREVTSLFYEAHEGLAKATIQDILATAKKEWGLYHASCVHRIGHLSIGEAAVAVVTTHAHRQEAYQANEYIINRVKYEAPIWKKEVFADGTTQWGANDIRESSE